MVIYVLLVAKHLEKDYYKYACMEHGGYHVVKVAIIFIVIMIWHVLYADNLATVENVSIN